MRTSAFRWIAVVGCSGLVAFFLGRCSVRPPETRGEPRTPVAGEAGKTQIWTCSMHPQIRQPKPGLCPICAMDLVPATHAGASAEEGSRILTLSKAAQALAEVETAPVERRFADVAVRLVGKVQFDETRLAHITARVAGRIERLYANVTGTRVAPGEHLADLYSPELLSAQQELLLAVRAAREAGTNGRPDASSFVESVRQKLRLWGFTPSQIAEIERSEKPQDRLTFRATVGGVIVAKEAVEGAYVEPGMRLFTVADLSRVWVKLDAYESDIAWLRYGQPVQFLVEAYPGETFRGTIAQVDPVLDPATRTVKVRVNAENADGRLKPEMFVRAVVRARTTADGKVVLPELAGKWISPMHPEVVKDGPGTCDVCGMPLVRAEDLGYAGKEPAAVRAPLVIPASAPLITGKRAIVYVAVPGREGAFEGREVVLGPRAEDAYVVRSGLREGEIVVVRGNFKIDSSLQIQGRASMMQPDAGTPGATMSADSAVLPRPPPSPAPESAADGRPQSQCPVMGGAINKQIYVDYQGQRIYLCCPACEEPFRKDPETYLRKMHADGVRPEVLK